ncbi:MAG: AarF/ABC1/UbiB kinase family protein, partial [Cyanobacteriota bacterium]|nr:AarF/ABC1/UbiB kinase family protein [Cyanobacteriota bacterium]
PDFNFMEVAKPFAMQIMSDSNTTNGNSILDELGRQAARASSTALGLPRRLEDTLEKLERGDIRVRVRSLESDRILRRMGTIQLLTNYTLLVAAFILSATILFVYDKGWLAAIAALAAGGAAIAMFRLWRRVDRLDRMP